MICLIEELRAFDEMLRTELGSSVLQATMRCGKLHGQLPWQFSSRKN